MALERCQAVLSTFLTVFGPRAFDRSPEVKSLSRPDTHARACRVLVCCRVGKGARSSHLSRAGAQPICDRLCACVPCGVQRPLVLKSHASCSGALVTLWLL